MRNAIELMALVLFLMLLVLFSQRIDGLAHIQAANVEDAVESTCTYDEHICEDLAQDYKFEDSLDKIVDALS